MGVVPVDHRPGHIEWLSWSAVGMEGLRFKRLDDRYRPAVRGWQKYKVRETSEAIVGAVTGTLAAPRSLLLGRYDTDGRLQYTGRTTTLTQTAGRAFAGLLAPAGDEHPWTGWTFSAGGTKETLTVTLVQPELVVEVDADIARDSAGRFRHPVRLHRTRPDVSPSDIARFRS
ncbi:ATP-dependent DNA ligase [Streptomyces avermitilis]|uniref:ATP-dependent DNA ligase n=1 Tax=Streptomyces avermitilis TaxID=33903 RepID=UPI0038013AFB